MKISDVKPGDRLVTDAGFTCMPAGSMRIVRSAQDKEGMFINCDDGKHFLNGQCDHEGHLVGLTRVPAATSEG